MEERQVPTDIESSSKQHGKDLSKHAKIFEAVFDDSKIKKFKCDYNTLSDAVRWAINNGEY